jgi:dihydrofolate reductase
MQKLIVFNNVTLDGYFTDARGDLSWAHSGMDDPEFAAFIADNASGDGGELLFGRVTYQLMASYWPTPQAQKSDPVVAKGMNSHRKVVFSRTLSTADWQNTRLVKDDLIGEVERLKSKDGSGLVLMGSGTIVAQLTPHRLIDEYQVVLNPVVIGGGRTMFDGAGLPLTLLSTRPFKNGKVVLRYAPKAG